MTVPLWGFVTFRNPNDTADRAGIRLGDGTVLRLDALDSYCGLAQALDDWHILEAIASTEPDGTPQPHARLRTPVRFPRKVLGAGANYASHIAEMNVSPIPPADDPFFFLVPPTTCVIGPDDEIQIPADPAAKVDWEVELGVVIGKRLKHASLDEATDGIAGWTIVNDISARGLMFKHDAPPPFHLNWVQQKALDTFMPVGPVVVPRAILADAHHLEMRLLRNGNVEQHSNTSDMIVNSFELVAAASRHVTLEPGDIIATGTPAGVGMPRNTFLKPGDTVVAEIDQLGSLRNPVTADPFTADPFTEETDR